MNQTSFFMRIGAGILAIAACTPLPAHEYHAKGFKVIHPWALASEPGETSAAVYVRFEEISSSDRLLAAESDLAEKIELREKRGTGVKTESMPLGNIALTSGETVDLDPDGRYLALINLKQPLQWERSYPMTLIFEKAGPVRVMVSIGAH